MNRRTLFSSLSKGIAALTAGKIFKGNSPVINPRGTGAPHASYEEANRRLARGQRQLYCPTCKKWRWPEECVHSGRITRLSYRLEIRKKIQEG